MALSAQPGLSSHQLPVCPRGRSSGSERRAHSRGDTVPALGQAPRRRLGASGPLGLRSDQVAPRPRYRADSGAGLPTLGGTRQGRTPLCLAGQCEDHPHRDQGGWGGLWMCRSSPPQPHRIRISGAVPPLLHTPSTLAQAQARGKAGCVLRGRAPPGPRLPVEERLVWNFP